MMKNIFLIILVFFALHSQAQVVVTADPGISAVQLTNDDGIATNTTFVSNLPFRARVAVFNGSAENAIPVGTTRIVIGLGGLLNVDTSTVRFNTSSSSISNFYRFMVVNVAGEIQIIGAQIREIPAKFVDSVVFRTLGTAVGTSAITTSIETLVGLDDRNPNNNSFSTPYTVFSTTLGSKLAEFNVVKNACNIDVNFVAVEQVNVNRYEIEVSKNGSDFSTLGSVSASSNGRYRTNYAITDAIKSASLYVRLKTVDNDGKVEYSAVRRIAGTCEARRTLVLNVYPNPITTGRDLTINSSEGSFDGKYNVSLLDVNGRLLQVREMQLNNVTNFRFNIGNLASGQYLIRVANTDQSESAVVRFQKY
jgi:hypothetical protein